jgi:GTP-binding protein LepA
MIKNFSIIAHIDAGKSTLADRLLEITNTVDARLFQEQFLDSNPIERERGITIKMAPVTMNYEGHILNLIDTPGHVDFNYEVERALAACEGAILLIDATKGVQAQTVSNLHLAQKLNLKLLPVINKIDAPLADISACQKQINVLLGHEVSPLTISAKTGQGIAELLKSVITQIPSPISQKDDPLRALVFNSVYHPHLGVIAFVRLVSGQLKKDERLQFLSNQFSFTAQEIGIFSPHREPQDKLESGAVGYIITGLKKISDVQIGDTITSHSNPSTSALPGFRHIKPNVYFDLFPIDNNRYLDLISCLDKLKLNDSSLETKPIKSTILGQGLRVGFLGLLHSEVVCERLEREFNLPVIATSPSVEYRANLTNGTTLTFTNASDFPDPSQIKSTEEPVSTVNLVTPNDYLGRVLEVCQNLRGQLINLSYLDRLVELEYRLPLIEVITSLHDQIKSVSSGFASINYEISGWQETELVKLTVLLNHEEASPLSVISPKVYAQTRARGLAARLKEAIPRQQFEVPIQVSIGGQVIARETVKAFRKDVTAKLYGGDRTRRMKLLEKQKKGKAKMKQIGQVNLPQEAFLAVIKT